MAWLNEPISKPYTISNLADVLSQGLLGSMSRFSHFQIVEWCARFIDEYDREPDPEIPATPDQAQEIADDVVVQWELYLATQYTLEELNRFSLGDVVLPKNYFETWLNQLLDLPPTH